MHRNAQNMTICFGILGILEIQDLKNDFVQGEQKSEFLFGLMKFLTWDYFEKFEEISCIESSCFQFCSCAWFEPRFWHRYLVTCSVCGGIILDDPSWLVISQGEQVASSTWPRLFSDQDALPRGFVEIELGPWRRKNRSSTLEPKRRKRARLGLAERFILGNAMCWWGWRAKADLKEVDGPIQSRLELQTIATHQLILNIWRCICMSDMVWLCLIMQRR